MSLTLASRYSQGPVGSLYSYYSVTTETSAAPSFCGCVCFITPPHACYRVHPPLHDIDYPSPLPRLRLRLRQLVGWCWSHSRSRFLLASALLPPPPLLFSALSCARRRKADFSPRKGRRPLLPRRNGNTVPGDSRYVASLRFYPTAFVDFVYSCSVLSCAPGKGEARESPKTSASAVALCWARCAFFLTLLFQGSLGACAASRSSRALRTRCHCGIPGTSVVGADAPCFLEDRIPCVFPCAHREAVSKNERSTVRCAQCSTGRSNQRRRQQQRWRLSSLELRRANEYC